MGDDSEWIKLPTDQKVEHKVWKARVAGYEELSKIIATADEKSPEFNKYQGLIKKFTMDSNAISQEKAMDCVVTFLENAPVSIVTRIATDVCGGIVTKCLNATRAKTKEKGIESLMLMIEAEKADIVQEELLKGLSNKQPKIVIGCIQSLRIALSGFGPKTLPAKPMMKVVPKLLEDRDKNVRDETKQLVIEVYRWVGPAIKPIISNLKPVQLSELEAEFESLPGGNPKQTRFLRSQQDLKAKMEAAGNEGEEGEEGEEDDEEEEAEVVNMDPYDMADPVEILSKLPKDYYEKIEAKKWQERREVLEVVQKLCESMKLEKGDYHDLVKTLRKVVSKDTNVMLVTIAAKCITGLAKGLRKNFTSFASGCIDSLLEKFREKKITVVTALREAVDIVYTTTTLEAISESCVEYLNHKTPSVKAETAAFLARCFTKCTPATLPKKMLKLFAAPLLKTANDTVPEVRESSYQALGTAMKVVSEKNIMPFLADVDNLKMTKIKESCDSAELATKSGKSAGTGAATAKPAAKAVPPTVKKPAGGAPKKAASGAPPKSAAIKGGGGKAKGKKPAAKGKKGGGQESTENVLSDEVVDEKAAELLPGDTLPGLASAVWKERLAAIEKFTDIIKGLSSSDIPCQVCVRSITKKPGLKENNFQVLKYKIELIGHLAQNSNFTQRSAEFCLNELVDKIGDAKNGSAVHETLSCMSEACSLEYISSQVIAYAFEQKNPKNQSESLIWLANAIKQFSFKVNVKPMITNVKKALAATNPAVRTAGMSLVGVFHIYMGPTARMFFEDEKPAVLAQIDAEIEKNGGVKPPAPTRRLRTAAGEVGDDEEEEEGDEEGEDGGGGGINVADLVPRNEIGDKITDALIEEINDKNWKVRNEGLQKVIAIINEAKFITPNLGDLPGALKTRLLKDSNKILVTTSLNICNTLATAMGPGIKKHVSLLGPGLLHCLGDSKPQLRATALTTFTSWVEQGGLGPFIEGEMLGDALKVENPFLRAEMFGWIADKLPDMKRLPAEISQCIPYLYAAMEDRKPEVRQKAQEAVLAFMIHLGNDRMLKMAGKLKPGSKEQVLQHLEKAKGNLPAKPIKTKAAPGKSASNTQSKKAVSDEDENDDEEEAVKAEAISKVSVKEPVKGKKPVSKKPVAAVTGKKKKEEEEDTGPALKINKDKEKRLKDEKTLKTLKWNFGTPQPEFIQQLKTQVEPNVSKTIFDQWFHADFKQHLKALDTMSKETNGDSMESTICSLDLILKWMTLRFFDTNTTVLLKCLEYLSSMFTNLAAVDYHLHDQEASCFIPYLVNKVGDPKDNVRRHIRNIFKMICKIYPASKMFLFVIDGLKSKNTKTRTECLEELGLLIEIYGITVCQPSPAAALKLIAGQIGQRDNNIRTSALNTCVIAYSILGETVYKYVGRLNDKDMGMLEERIKRSGKTKPNEPSAPTSTRTSPDEKPKNIARVAPSQQRAPSADGNRISKSNTSRRDFVLDIEDSDSMTDSTIPQLVQHQDLDEILNEPIKMPETRARPPSPSMKLITGSSEARSAVNLVISEIASTDIKTTIQALAQIDEVLRDEEKSEALHDHVDQLIVMFSLKLRMTYSKHLTSNDNDAVQDSLKCYRSLLATIVSLFTSKSLAKEAARDVLKDLIYHLVTIMLDPRLEELDDGVQIVKSVNCTVVKIVEKSDPTHITCALLRLLHETVGSDTASSKFQEIVMKCLWKVCRALPQMINDLNIDRVMAEVHLFLKTYPGPTWANRPTDTPLRTIKTITHSITKLRGNKVLGHLTLVDTSNSELENYIKKVLKNSGIDVAAKNSQNEQMNGNANITDDAVELRGTARKDSSKSNKRLSKSTHDMLAEIFKKIGSKENTREGLNDLYDFKLKFPDADLEPFLKKSSQFFQNYIERGLKNITLEREGKMKASASEPAMSQSSSSGSVSSHVSASGGDDCNPSVYMERLKALRERCGLDNNNERSEPHSRVNNNSGSDKPTFSLLGKTGVENGSNSSLSSGSSTGMPQLGTTLSKSTSKEDTSENSIAVTNVADLKRRLERIKMSQK